VRIVGGEARGRRLRAVPGRSTRPTADRVRQSLFDLLGQRCDGLRVLDLYAGTGALALEALSRGASRATLVEQDARAAAVIERNASELGFRDRVEIVREDVARALPRLGGPFDLVFSDPPYALRAGQDTLEALARLSLVAPSGRVVLERARREHPPSPPPGFSRLDERGYGDTVICVLARDG
jgi:16S rRNA (guanine(966)-N(2))-methyltransferase RsmD